MTKEKQADSGQNLPKPLQIPDPVSSQRSEWPLHLQLYPKLRELLPRTLRAHHRHPGRLLRRVLGRLCRSELLDRRRTGRLGPRFDGTTISEVLWFVCLFVHLFVLFFLEGVQSCVFFRPRMEWLGWMERIQPQRWADWLGFPGVTDRSELCRRSEDWKFASEEWKIHSFPMFSRCRHMTSHLIPFGWCTPSQLWAGFRLSRHQTRCLSRAS